MTERSVRQAFFNTLMNVSHRNVGPIMAQLSSETERDPDWAGRLMTWVVLPGNTRNRDLQEACVASLLTASLTSGGLRSPLLDFRDCGQALMLGSDFYTTEPEVPGLEPYRVLRVFGHVGNGSPRRMRAIWERYLEVLSSDHQRLDGVVLRNRAVMRRIWHKFHTSSSQFSRANALLFGSPPEDSKLHELKVIANMPNSIDRARALAEGRFPFTVFTSVVGEISPAAAVAALTVMSPQEALNSTAWLKRIGVLDHPEVFKMYESRVKKATKSAATVTKRKSVQVADEKVQAVLAEVEQAAVEAETPIKGSVSLIIDKSGSMDEAIEIAVQLAVRIGARCVDGLSAVAFDSLARKVPISGHYNVSGLRSDFSRIRAGGSTNITAGLRLAESEWSPDRFVIITDEGHNVGPWPHDWWISNQASVGHKQFIIIRVGHYAENHVANRLQSAGANVAAYSIVDPKDYYVLDQVSAALAGDPVKSIVETIMEANLVRILNG